MIGVAIVDHTGLMIDADIPAILTVGRFDDVKGMQALVDAYDMTLDNLSAAGLELPADHLLIAGNYAPDNPLGKKTYQTIMVRPPPPNCRLV